MSRPIKISRFNDKTYNQPQPVTLPSWEAFAEVYSKHQIGPKEGFLWSPATFKEGTKRAKTNVETLSVLTFDIDDISPEQFESLLQAVEASNAQCLIYSTHSHTKDAPKARLVFNLTRDVTPAEYQKLFAVVADGFKIPFDRATRTDTARMYYEPRVKPDAETVGGTSGTEPVDVDEMLALEAPKAIVPPHPPTAAVETTVDMEQLRNTLRYGGKEENRKLYTAILKGEPLGPPGEREPNLLRVVGFLAFKALDVPDEAILELIRPALRATPSDSGHDWEKEARAKLTRAKEQARASLEAERHQTVLWLDAMRKKAPPAPDAPPAPADGEPTAEASPIYTPEQFETWARQQRTDAEGLKRRLVIQRDGRFRTFVHGTYQREISRMDLETVLPQDFSLIPEDWGVKLFTTDKQGKKSLAPVGDFLRNHAVVARGGVISHFDLPFSYYEPSDQIFHEALCTPRPKYAERSEEILEYLYLLGGKSEVVWDWVASCFYLHRPASILFVRGQKSAGKSLFANCVSTIWTDAGPTAMNNILGTAFNDSLRQCPLVFADENLPDVKGRTAHIRRLVSQGMHPVNAKYSATSSLSGYARIYVGANNANIFQTSESLNQDDIDAIAQRLRMVEPDNEAGRFLQSIRDERGGDFIDTEWRKRGLFARTALWLAQNRELDFSTRWLVEGQQSTVTELLTTTAGANDLVIQFLGAALLALARHHPNDPNMKLLESHVQVGEGMIWVNAGAFSVNSLWEKWVPSQPAPPRPRVLMEAVQALTCSTESSRIYVGDQYLRFWRIPHKFVMSYIDDQGAAGHAVKAIMAENPRLKSLMAARPDQCLNRFTSFAQIREK